jgi:hypothetical protein
VMFAYTVSSITFTKLRFRWVESTTLYIPGAWIVQTEAAWDSSRTKFTTIYTRLATGYRKLGVLAKRARSSHLYLETPQTFGVDWESNPPPDKVSITDNSVISTAQQAWLEYQLRCIMLGLKPSEDLERRLFQDNCFKCPPYYYYYY